MAHLPLEYKKPVYGFLGIHEKSRFFGQKTNFQTLFSNFWKFGKIFWMVPKDGPFNG